MLRELKVTMFIETEKDMMTTSWEIDNTNKETDVRKGNKKKFWAEKSMNWMKNSLEWLNSRSELAEKFMYLKHKLTEII